MDCRRFEGKVALVTGGAQGIGAACAHRFAAEGASVVIADVADADDVVKAIVDAGGEAFGQRCDVASADDWAALAAAVRDRYGRLDVLHSNAYANTVAAAHELAESEWDRAVAVSLKAAWLGVRAFLEPLRAARGAVVLTSSVHALVGLPGHPAYAAAKGALCALARQLAVEYAPDLRVNAVLPGPVMTAAWDRVDAGARAASVAQTPAGRFGEPTEVAAAVAFLASADASFVTGASLVVDGGWSVYKSSA